MPSQILALPEEAVLPLPGSLRSCHRQPRTALGLGTIGKEMHRGAQMAPHCCKSCRRSVGDAATSAIPPNRSSCCLVRLPLHAARRCASRRIGRSHPRKVLARKKSTSADNSPAPPPCNDRTAAAHCHARHFGSGCTRRLRPLSPFAPCFPCRLRRQPPAAPPHHARHGRASFAPACWHLRLKDARRTFRNRIASPCRVLPPSPRHRCVASQTKDFFFVDDLRQGPTKLVDTLVAGG